MMDSNPASATNVNNYPMLTPGMQTIVQKMLDDQKINHDDLSRAQMLHQENVAVPFATFLIRLGLISEFDLAEIQSRIFGLSLLTEDDLPEYPLENNKLSVKFMRNACLLPLAEDHERIVIALADASDPFLTKSVELACNKPVETKIGLISQIDNALNRIYNDNQSALAGIAGEIETDNDISETDSIEKLKNLAGEAPIVRLVNLIISRAIESRASDIHIEPFENRLKVRYRIDGVLQDAESPPVRSTAAVVSRIKIMAKLNIAERRLPQDGRIQLRNQGKLIDLRVSTVPTLYGESLVLRVLDKQRVQLDLPILGFDQNVLGQLLDILAMPHGIILVTGPTGSGKTTTLYAALQHLNTPDKKILTVEDPIEYQLEGINQIQVKPQIGLTFSDALRSIVRQDPDIIMIGEMRDLETARIAVQSALTGHLVLSTLHTNDAGSSVTRLLDMGVEDYLLTSTLNGILAQRLVRSLCSHCKESFVAPPELVRELSLNTYTDSDNPVLYKPAGCKQCANTGYHGRTIIIETLPLYEDIRRLILARADGSSIQRAAIESGMLTMKDNGIKKALRGITTIEEVTRVTQDA